MNGMTPESLPPEQIPPLQDVTIRNFERQPHSQEELYAQLFATNEPLALFIRRRATELTQDLQQREQLSRLALEVAILLGRDLQAERDNLAFIRQLEQLFAVPAGPEEKPAA